jgi:hypothetical protein
MARGACLQRLALDLARDGGTRLVIEREDPVLKDLSVLFSAVDKAGVGDALTYEHVRARSEPLLWIPDAAAWCWTHGTQWRRRIAPVVRRVTQL